MAKRLFRWRLMTPVQLLPNSLPFELFLSHPRSHSQLDIHPASPSFRPPYPSFHHGYPILSFITLQSRSLHYRRQFLLSCHALS